MLGFHAEEKLRAARPASELTQDPASWTQLLGCSLRPRQSEYSTKPSHPLEIKTAPSEHQNGGSMRFFARPATPELGSLQLILPEHLFLEMLCLERKRAERSRKRFFLMLLDTGDSEKPGRKSRLLEGVIKAADGARRDTDPAGWYKQNSVLGIIFTEPGSLDDAATSEKLLNKIHTSLAERLSLEDLRRVQVTAHIFPHGTDVRMPGNAVNSTFYPDILGSHDSNKLSQMLKRVMDVLGSAAALLILLPLCLLIAVAIKLTSKGPVFFQQERLGRFGTKFQCLKFRSMDAGNDPKIHQEFVRSVIAGWHKGNTAAGEKAVYKMTDDPRVTPIGRILRRTSLDELPQFINVLKGDMSLVGPRPPLAYEFQEYDFWHRRRVMEAKPGITGLWQVRGRSRVRFDDMVRLDLQYARGWSLWLDIQILAQTPRAVVFGDGAY